jgi:hypothetical protein
VSATVVALSKDDNAIDVGAGLRQAIHEAISKRARALAEVDRHRAAIERAEILAEASRDKIAAAEAGLAAAKEAHARSIAASISSGSSSSPGLVRAARAAETEARDDATAAKEAAQISHNNLGPLLEDVKRAELTILEAHARLCASVADELLPAALAAKKLYFLAKEILPLIVADETRVPKLADDLEQFRRNEERRKPLEKARREIGEFLLENRVLNGPQAQLFKSWRARSLQEPDLESPAWPPT